VGIRNYRLHRIIGYYRCRFEYDDSERGEADQSTNLEPLQLTVVAAGMGTLNVNTLSCSSEPTRDQTGSMSHPTLSSSSSSSYPEFPRKMPHRPR